MLNLLDKKNILGNIVLCSHENNKDCDYIFKQTFKDKIITYFNKNNTIDKEDINHKINYSNDNNTLYNNNFNNFINSNDITKSYDLIFIINVDLDLYPCSDFLNSFSNTSYKIIISRNNEYKNYFNFSSVANYDLLLEDSISPAIQKILNDIDTNV